VALWCPTRIPGLARVVHVVYAKMNAYEVAQFQMMMAFMAGFFQGQQMRIQAQRNLPYAPVENARNKVRHNLHVEGVFRGEVERHARVA
jgi:hypothetical protein